MINELLPWWKGYADAQLERALHPSNRGRRIVLDFDNTCILGDTGELFHLYLSEKMAWDLNVFVSEIAPEDGQARLRELLALRAQGRDYETEIFKELMAAFPRRMARAGNFDTYAWAARLQVGAQVSALKKHARAMLQMESEHPRELFTVDVGDKSLAIQRGIRSRPAFDALIDAAQAQGIEPWVITATNSWVVSVAAEDFGIPSARVIGNNHRVVHGVVQPERDIPVTIQQGKADAYTQQISRDDPPILVIGDSRSDYELMRISDDAILVDRGDAVLRERAESHGWAVIPEDVFDTVPWGTLHPQRTRSE